MSAVALFTDAVIDERAAAAKRAALTARLAAEQWAQFRLESGQPADGRDAAVLRLLFQGADLAEELADAEHDRCRTGDAA